MSESEHRLFSIFAEALEIDDLSARKQYLAQACGTDSALQQEVEGLIAAAAISGRFLPSFPATKASQAALHGAADALGPRPDLSDCPGTEKPGDWIGRYHLMRRLGEGGCGTVYMAEQEEPVKRRVALKVIKLGMDTRQVIARFEAERQALALMDHPHIAKVLDGGATSTGRPYFVMELVRGVPITRYCDENRLDTTRRLDLFILVCQAVQHAHQKGVIHRDIKPSNILVGDHDGTSVPKVIDFGIAKATAGQTLTDKTLFTAFEQFMGTPAYMSPEQAKLSGLDIDTRSDIYSLGVLLYELLTGKTPFDADRLLGAGLDGIRRIIREEDPPKPSTKLRTLEGAKLIVLAKHRGSEPPKLLGMIRGDLDWIVMKCLEKDRSRRYETANGLAMDLKRHLDSEPVVARPPNAAYRLQKAWRRNKLSFTAGGAIVAALVVGIAISTWQGVVAIRAKNEALQAKAKAVAAQREAEESQQAEYQQRQRAEKGETEARRLLYAADMNLAQEAWDQNRIGRVKQLLQDTRMSPDRGFEWYYWQRHVNLELKTLRGHLGPVASVAFSPDGQRIVTGSDDRTAKVWDASSGNELLTLKGHRESIQSVAFSPDGQRIVTGSKDKTAKVWETASGKQLLTLKAHSDKINSVAFSPDGRRLVSGSGDGTAKVWEAVSGKELLTLWGHKGGVWSVGFSPDGQRIVTGSLHGTATVWEAGSGKELLTLEGHRGEILSAIFSPDGRRIVTGSGDETAKVWDASSGKELLTLKGHSGEIRSAVFSPDGQRIVTGSGDDTANVWEAATGKSLLTLKGHSARIASVAFSPDGQRIVTGSWDETCKVWEADSAKAMLMFKGNAEILAVAFSPDGQRIVASSRDKTATMWEVASGKQLPMFKGTTEILTVAFSPDGQRIVTGGHDKTTKVWEVASGKVLLTLRGHSGELRAAVFSPDGQRVVTGSYDRTAKVWEAASGKELLTLRGHSDEIAAVACSPDGQRILTGSHDKTAKVWEAASGKELFTLLGHNDEITSVAFSPDGKWIVTGSEDTTAKVWEAANGKQLLSLKGHSREISSVAFSPDGRRIVTGSWDTTAKVWEVFSGKELLTLKGHRESIQSVAFSPDGQRIVTGSYDRTARVWEAGTPKQVADWQAEQQEAEKLRAVLQREHLAIEEAQAVVRARESIKKWLILAPIPLAAGQSEAEGLDSEQLVEERQLQPKAGESSSIGRDELKWGEVALTNEVIDFNAMLGQLTEHSVAYAVCYIWSEAEQRGLQMLVGSDDQAKVYLNEKEIYKSPNLRSFVAEQDDVQDITLNAGLNVLVFKVVNETTDWQGSIRFTDAQGNPVKRISVSLDPDAKN